MLADVIALLMTHVQESSQLLEPRRWPDEVQFVRHPSIKSYAHHMYSSVNIESAWRWCSIDVDFNMWGDAVIAPAHNSCNERFNAAAYRLPELMRYNFACRLCRSSTFVTSITCLNNHFRCWLLDVYTIKWYPILVLFVAFWEKIGSSSVIALLLCCWYMLVSSCRQHRCTGCFRLIDVSKTLFKLSTSTNLAEQCSINRF